ncbi:unannotated protein [freshwater metagenome]|uniref:Unannotated protein n=1 Tax=freshwater metagenome TaxID=449393 RepID=A0A6J7T5G1_9ZZZZ
MALIDPFSFSACAMAAMTISRADTSPEEIRVAWSIASKSFNVLMAQP